MTVCPSGASCSYWGADLSLNGEHRAALLCRTLYVINRRMESNVTSASLRSKTWDQVWRIALDVTWCVLAEPFFYSFKQTLKSLIESESPAYFLKTSWEQQHTGSRCIHVCQLTQCEAKRWQILNKGRVLKIPQRHKQPSTYFPSNVMKLDLNVAYTQERLPGPMYRGPRLWNHLTWWACLKNEWMYFIWFFFFPPPVKDVF